MGWLVITAMMAMTSCKEGKSEAEKDKGSEKKAGEKTPSGTTEIFNEEQKQVALEHSAALESFTGAHTRIVWSAQEKEDKADPFAVGGNNILRALDSRDGLGVRTLIAKRGNYARPLLNHDGTVILYTDKGITKSDDNKKHYEPIIYQLGWDGGVPQKVAEGYAMDTWVDPVTKIEWVYAARKLVPSSKIAIEARNLVRFPLNDPSEVEMVYDETPIGTDNFQLSRDGTRASGLFPWPHCGVFRVEEGGQWVAEKRLTGCWPSMAPDNSGVSWVFDGPHRNGYLFADDDRPHWVVPFNTDKRMKNAEVYHPRWSNHARYLAITGPYIKDKNVSGSIIGKGGSSADVYLAKLDEKATQIESWFRVNDDNRGDAYPDVWIAGGENSNLVGYNIKKDHSSGTDSVLTWPVVKEGHLLVWKDRKSLNSFKTREGHKLETRMDGQGAARYGRFNELVLDGGWYEGEAESTEVLLQHLASGKDLTFETLVFPGQAAGNGTLLEASGFKMQWIDGVLNVHDGKNLSKTSSAVLPTQPFHLLLTRTAGQWSVHVDGKPQDMTPTVKSSDNPASVATLRLGGNWDAGVQWLAAYDVAMSTEMIQQSVSAAQNYLQHLPPAPATVKLRGKLVEESAMPTAEGIDPYRNALVAYVYEVEEVLSGEYEGDKVFVMHWAMLGLEEVMGFPRELDQSYELTIEKMSDHPYLNGERVMDDTIEGLSLQKWIDVTAPRTKTD